MHLRVLALASLTSLASHRFAGRLRFESRATHLHLHPVADVHVDGRGRRCGHGLGGDGKRMRVDRKRQRIVADRHRRHVRIRPGHGNRCRRGQFGQRLAHGLAHGGGQSVSVTQQGLTCTYVLQPASRTLDAADATASFDVNTDAACNWTAAPTVPWLTLVSRGVRGRQRDRHVSRGRQY